MEVGTVTKQVVSKAKRKRHGKQTQEVIFKTYLGKHKGKQLFSSQTRHELV